ncbi:MAG: FeoA family protein [Anaerolineaceae bacterium]|jgi:ferrous iron transport protein A
MTTTSIHLLEAKPGESVRILGLGTKASMRQKLQQYGLFAGDIARVVRIAPFEGPILLSINGREIALGESIAAQILVEKIS